MSGHHLVMGEIEDFISGQRLPDTHDERYRQKIARLLVERKGYPSSALHPLLLEIRTAGKCARVPITWTVHQHDRMVMLVHYGPGSLVTRHRPALALGRLAAPYQIPVVVVSNGEEADILDGTSGRVIAHGFEAIPSAQDMAGLVAKHAWTSMAGGRLEKERRIVMAYEVDDRCPCDDTICRL